MSAGRSGGLSHRFVDWGVNLTIFFAVVSVLFGATIALNLGTVVFKGLGDGIHAVVTGLPVMAQHAKAEPKAKPSAQSSAKPAGS